MPILPSDPPRRWLTLAILAYVAAAALAAPSVFASLVRQSVEALPLAVGVGAAMGLGRAALLRWGGRPLAEARGPIVRAVVAVLVLWLGLTAFTTLKLQIPVVAPFHLDDELRALDVWLHGGDIGLALHDALPRAADGLLTAAYYPMWLALVAGTVGAVALSEDAALRLRFYWTFLGASVLLGFVLAAAMSSVGPIFLDRVGGGDHYAELLGRLAATSSGQRVLAVADYLWRQYAEGGNRVGSGISAMPSMHVATATLVALGLGSLSRWLIAPAVAYLLTIQAGSVYLAWHYGVDGYVSVAAVLGLWWLAGRVLGASAQAAPAAEPASAPAQAGAAK